MSPTLDLLITGRVSWVVGIVLLTAVLRFWQRLHYQRNFVKGLPGPPHSYIWGSLKSMNEVISKQPARAAPQCFFNLIQEHYSLGDWFVVDPWPFGDPMIIANTPEMAQQFVVKPSAPKHVYVDDFMKNFGGPANLVSSEGAVWKKWRQIFNPGFSASHLQTQIPFIVEEVELFRDMMIEHAKKNDLFRMETATTKLTIDVIGQVVLATKLHAQTEPYNELVSAFGSQCRWQPIGVQYAPTEIIDFRIPIVQAWNNYRMDRFLGRCLDNRIASHATSKSSDEKSKPRDKHVLDLAYEAYLKETGEVHNPSTKLPRDFRRAAIANAKAFVFAGHDTTSSTICYSYYYLSQHPSYLSRLRSEISTHLGTNPAETLKFNPTILNNLTYTTAVLREVLRLQPPASSIRGGTPDITLRDSATGLEVRTAGWLLWAVDVGQHRNPHFWADPKTFNPSRFIPNDPAAPPNAPYTNNASNPAYVPFSKGPRNCIGQELAMIEAKIILAMTVGEFDFEACYGREDLLSLRGDGSGYPSAVDGVLEVDGERAYQIQLGSAKPNEGMPCRLRLRKDVEG